MFTGLSATSSLRVRLRVYVEKAPSISAVDAGLAVLATPSASYDAAALKCYSEIVPRMPVGCPVSMNSFAEWWSVVSDLARNVAIPIGMTLGGPAGAAVGAAVRSLIPVSDEKRRMLYPPRAALRDDREATIPSRNSGKKKQKGRKPLTA